MEHLPCSPRSSRAGGGAAERWVYDNGEGSQVGMAGGPRECRDAAAESLPSQSGDPFLIPPRRKVIFHVSVPCLRSLGSWHEWKSAPPSQVPFCRSLGASTNMGLARKPEKSKNRKRKGLGHTGRQPWLALQWSFNSVSYGLTLPACSALCHWSKVSFQLYCINNPSVEMSTLRPRDIWFSSVLLTMEEVQKHLILWLVGYIYMVKSPRDAGKWVNV